MTRFGHRFFASLLMAFLGCLASLSIAWAEMAEPAKLLGAWQENGASRLLRFESSRVVEFQGQGLSRAPLIVKGIVRKELGQMQLRAEGFPETWNISFDRGYLRVEQVDQNSKVFKVGLFRRLPVVPSEVDLRPVPLGTRRSLGLRQVEEIQAEITNRFQEEQELYKSNVISPEEKKEKVSVMKAANLTYLSSLIRDIGWIDVKRFGSRVSVCAVILAKHTGDLRLMMAILPEAKRDLQYSGEGQTYAVLYDSLQIELGGKQRYGTQVGEDGDGDPFVLPLEDPAKVDLYLNQMGLPPFKKYLSDVSDYFYSGKQIRVAKENK